MPNSENAKAKVLKFRDELISLGVIKAVVPYNGSGDEGTTEPVQMVTSNKSTPFGGVIPEGLQKALDAFEPIGYENNEGGFGEITFDVASSKITVTQNYYVSSSEEGDTLEY